MICKSEQLLARLGLYYLTYRRAIKCVHLQLVDVLEVVTNGTLAKPIANIVRQLSNLSRPVGEARNS